MYNAQLKLEMGKDSKEIFSLLDKNIKFKRSTIKFTLEGESILVEVGAENKVAMIASLNSVLKQIRIIGNAQKLFDE